MAKDKRRIAQNRARKLARVAARKKRRKQASMGEGRSARLGCSRREVAEAPLHAVYVAHSIFSQGIGQVVVARKLPDGQIVAGVFLIDAYCLGVKNAFLTVRSSFDFEDTIETRFAESDLRTADPAYARKLIEDAIAYARNLGFEPHPDFQYAALVLGDIDPEACSDVFTFGKDGKPLYVSGPNDSEAMIARVIARLRDRGGPDGADYLVRLGAPETDDDSWLDGNMVDEDAEDDEGEG